MSDDSDTEPESSTVETPPEPMEYVLEKFKTPKIAEWWIIDMLANYHRHDAPDSGRSVTVDDIALKHVAIEAPYEDADTALSDIHRMRLEYEFEENVTLHLIVKQLPRDPFSRFFVKEAQFDIREMKFYNEIIPDMREFQKKHSVDLDLPVPKCYYPSQNFDSKGAPDVVLILEDLKARGFCSSRFSDGLTMEDAVSALQAIAKIHALSLSMKIEYGNLNEKYPFLFQMDKATDSYQMLLERGLPQLGVFLESKPQMRNIFQNIAHFQTRSKHIISSLLTAKEPMALLTHTDFWCNNLLFQRENNLCVIVDWQMITYSQPTNDVALLILSSLPTQLRRESTNDLLDHYWEALIQNALKLGVNIENDFGYYRTDLQKDYTKSQLLAVLLCIGSVDIALGNATTEKRLLDLLEDLHNAQIFSEKMINECVC